MIMRARIEEVESLNYDYLPGEPQSRRVWYITMRRPVDPPEALQRGMFLKFYIKHHSNTLIPDDRIFQVDDIYGRHVIVTPISDAHGGYGNMRLTNYDVHHNQGAHTYINRLGMYENNLHPRMGVELYTSRPAEHNSSTSFIEFPVPPAIRGPV